MPTLHAVNVADLSELSQGGPPGFNMAALLLTDFVPTQAPEHVWIDTSRLDSTAVILTGPAATDSSRVTALIDLLQTVLGPRIIKRRVRCYKTGPKGGWSEIVPTTRKYILSAAEGPTPAS